MISGAPFFPLPAFARGEACPPEDCGGPYGYAGLLEVIKNPKHEGYEERMEWLGGNFDLEFFDLLGVQFSDPEEEWKFCMEMMG